LVFSLQFLIKGLWCVVHGNEVFGSVLIHRLYSSHQTNKQTNKQFDLVVPNQPDPHTWIAVTMMSAAKISKSSSCSHTLLSPEKLRELGVHARQNKEALHVREGKRGSPVLEV
jgi:hypothetical protein